MPKIDTTAETVTHTDIPGFSYSSVRPDRLTSASYTLATIMADTSPSVSPYLDKVKGVLKSAIAACRISPMRANILVRVGTFNSSVQEVHGFMPLDMIDETAYDKISTKGLTALYDAVVTASEATLDYSEKLAGMDYELSAVIFVITDGLDNRSGNSPAKVKEKIDALTKSEKLSTCRVVLVGINFEPGADDALKQFASAMGIEYKNSDVTPREMAKLAEFISQSVSSSSVTPVVP